MTKKLSEVFLGRKMTNDGKRARDTPSRYGGAFLIENGATFDDFACLMNRLQIVDHLNVVLKIDF